MDTEEYALAGRNLTRNGKSRNLKRWKMLTKLATENGELGIANFPFSVAYSYVLDSVPGVAVHGYFALSLASTSFQNAAAGMPLMPCKVVMERSGDGSVTGAPWKFRPVSGMPFKGDRSLTFVAEQSRVVSGMPASGARLATSVLAQ